MTIYMIVLVSVLGAGSATAQTQGLTPGDNITVYRNPNGTASAYDQHGNRVDTYTNRLGTTYYTHPSNPHEPSQTGSIYEPYRPRYESKPLVIPPDNFVPLSRDRR